MSLFQIAQLRSVPSLMRTITALFITLALLFPREGARARVEMMHNCERLETYWRCVFYAGILPIGRCILALAAALQTRQVFGRVETEAERLQQPGQQSPANQS